MNTVQLSEKTYQWLKRRASKADSTPDKVADSLLQLYLHPEHAYVRIAEKYSGAQAIIKDTNVTVSQIIGYIQVGETPESIVNELLPHLNLAQVYDALSYYYDHREDIDAELAAMNETSARAYLREHLGDEGYLQITGQKNEPPTR
ncbi:MAG TPA: DUF433 domain-containing protein [Chloroflexota bacterium]|nr:DUF433 domain-containing protein [Chloroflexota bacterium]HUM69916.1 DUF433 domain-containing protein [Chloroflexota bacterium]